MLNGLEEKPETAIMEPSRNGFWEIFQKTLPSTTVDNCTVAEPEIAPQALEQKQDLEGEQAEEKCLQLPNPVLNDSRELPEAKLLKQLSEMTHLLEQQTTILYAQQKLLEDLTGRQKKPAKRKPGMTKKIKSLIHKGKIIWSAL